MQLLNELSWWAYRGSEAVIRRAGLRKYRFGKTIVAKLNRAGGVVLKNLFSRSNSPLTVHGQQMYVAGDRSAGIALTMSLLADQYEKGTTEFFKQFLRRGSVVMDVGAHVGYYTLLAAHLVGPEGRVYAFEPDPANYALLQRNIELNRFNNVVAIPKAIASKTAKLRLFRDSRGSDRHSLCRRSTTATEEEYVEVQATSLDDFLETEGWPHIDLIKIDIEGAEPMALEGMRRSLEKGDMPNLILEFGPLALEANGISPQGFLEHLVGLGFQILNIDDTGKPNSVSPADFPLFIESLERKGATNLLCERVKAGGATTDANP